MPLWRRERGDHAGPRLVRVGSQTKSFVLKCDLCVDRPGGPACAEACPTKGLTLVDEECLAELTAERARATIENEA